MKSDNFDIVCNVLLVYSSLQKLGFDDMKSDKLDVFCYALLVCS